MENEKTIYNELKLYFLNEFPKDEIHIKEIKVKRRNSKVYKIIRKNDYQKNIYFAKQYLDFKRIDKILELNKYQFNSKEYKITKPIFFIQNIKTLIFSNIEGIKLSYFILFFACGGYYIYTKKALNIFRKVAQCLSYIQKNTYSGKKQMLDIEFTFFVLKKLDFLNEIEKYKVYCTLKNNYEKIGDLPLLFNHKDFVSKNIFICNDHVGLIDVDLYEFDNRLFDIHSFISNLETKAFIPLYSKKVITILCDEFIKEYTRFYPIRLSNDIFYYTKLNYLLLYLHEKQNLTKTMNYLHKMKSNFFMQQLKKKIAETVDYLES